MTAIRHRLTVLLAEDDENDLVLIRRAFDRLRSVVRLIAVPDGEVAITYLRAEGRFADREKWPVPDVLLLDQWMPRATGLDVLTWLRSEPQFALLPVALISGGLSPEQARAAHRLRAASCPKGADATGMIHAIDCAMESAQNLARDAWFVSRAAYAPPRSLFAEEAEPIRVWT